jgi:hypothetical protein
MLDYLIWLRPITRSDFLCLSAILGIRPIKIFRDETLRGKKRQFRTLFLFGDGSGCLLCSMIKSKKSYLFVMTVLLGG